MLPVKMCFVSAFATRRRALQPTKYRLGYIFLHAAALQYVFMHNVNVCVQTEGGPNGRGRVFLGTGPLTVKHFRGCPSTA